MGLCQELGICQFSSVGWWGGGRLGRIPHNGVLSRRVPLDPLNSLLEKLAFLCLYVHSKCSEKAMAPHSSTPAWKIPWTEEPGRLQSMGSRRVGHN